MYSRIEDARYQQLRSEINRRAIEQATDHSADSQTQPDSEQSGTDVFMSKNSPGSWSWKSDQVADALAISKAYGPPSLFITITANPEWPEIRNRLIDQTQTAYDIPIIVARVFHARMNKAMTKIKDKFGELLYHIKVIEFQKRGLPHCHMVLKV